MESINRSSALLLKAAIDSGITSPAELSALMGNASVETARFTRMREDLGYKSVQSVLRSSKSAATRYTIAEIQEAVDSGDPEKIATVLYEGRNSGRHSLGNSEVGDGWRFHGRGYFQFTGRYNYKTYGEKFGIDLVSDPDKAMDPEFSAKLALAFWKTVPERMREDPVAAGQRINGAKHAAADRLDAARRWATFITPDLVWDVQRGAMGLDDLEALGSSGLSPERHGRREQVEALQADLNRLGYADAAGQELTVDGDYGRRTRLAVEDFQRSHGLVADGIAGPLTIAAVQRAVETELRSIGQPDAPYLRPEQQPTESLSAYRSLAPDTVASPVMPVVRPEVSSRADDASDREAQAHQGEADRRLATAPDRVAMPMVAAWSERTSHDRQDPRHPQSPNHDLYGELKRRIPDASEDRLLQFTAACHENRITANNMVEARLDEARGTLTFIGSGPLTTPAQIDLKNAPPRPEEAIEHIQQHDLQQARVMEEVRVQQAQVGMGHSR